MNTRIQSESKWLLEYILKKIVLDTYIVLSLHSTYCRT